MSFEDKMIDLLNDVTDGQLGTTYVIEAAKRAAYLHRADKEAAVRAFAERLKKTASTHGNYFEGRVISVEELDAELRATSQE